MTAVAPETAPETAASGGPGVRILAQFIRDLSFENPRAPDSLRAEGKPGVEMNVEMSGRGRPDGLFEVDLKISCLARVGEQPTFQVELVYGGLFEITGATEEQIEPMLLVECPRYLFPFSRRIIADLATDGGFAPLLLEPLDFAAVYQAQRSGAGGEVTLQ